MPHNYKDLTWQIPLASASLFVRQESLCANRTSKFGMLVEPSFLRKHRLYRCCDKPTRICFGARGINVFNNAVCGRQQSRFLFPEQAKFLNQELQRNALLRAALIIKRVECLYQHIPVAI